MRRAILVVPLFAACSSGTEPIDLAITPAELAVVAGDAQLDTIEAQLADPILVELRTADAEARPIPGVVVNFVVLQDGCGEPFAGASITDAAGQAAERWILGDIAGECTMEVRAVDSDGTPRVLAAATATIEPGKAVGVLTPGQSTSVLVGAPVGLQGFDARLQDRAGNVIAGYVSLDSVPSEVTRSADTVRASAAEARLLARIGDGFYSAEEIEVTWLADLGRGTWTLSFACAWLGDPERPDSTRYRYSDGDSIQWTEPVGATAAPRGALVFGWLRYIEYWPANTDTIEGTPVIGTWPFTQRVGAIDWGDVGISVSDEGVPTRYVGGDLGCAKGGYALLEPMTLELVGA